MNLIALLRAAQRGTQFVLHISLGAILCSGYRLRFGSQWHLTSAGLSIIRWWMQHMTRIIGIRITQYGMPRQKRVLFVANHISFLDIVVISSVMPVRFLAKECVRYWPLIGYLTAMSGTLFIKRGQRKQMATMIDTVGKALQSERPLVLFPEGTTSTGQQVLKFHTGLFQAAITSRTPVQPITLHYRRDGKADRLAAYIDKDNFLLSLIRLLAQPTTEVHLCFSEPIQPATQSRQQLARHCHAEVSRVLAAFLQHPATVSIIDDDAEFAILGECDA